MPLDGTQLDEVTQILSRAYEILEGGWCQRHMQDYVGSYCILGAISKVFTENGCVPSINYHRARWRIEQAIEIDYGANVVSDFNDFPGRTKEEVLDVVAKAISIGPR